MTVHLWRVIHLASSSTVWPLVRSHSKQEITVDLAERYRGCLLGRVAREAGQAGSDMLVG